MNEQQSNVNYTVEEAFEFFKVKSRVKKEFGFWAVSEDGDVVLHSPDCALYAIFSYQLQEQNWLEHLKTKEWFKEEVESNFPDALNYAKNIAYEKRVNESNTIICPHCNAEIYVREVILPGEGCKDKEEVICPSCHMILYTRMINGWFEIKLKK